jgi:hypothetical protein
MNSALISFCEFLLNFDELVESFVVNFLMS